MFIVALFTVAKIWKQLKCPLIDEWVKKICTHTHTHTHSHISFFLDKPLAYLRNSDSSVTSHYRAWYGSKFRCCKEQYCIGT